MVAKVWRASCSPRGSVGVAIYAGLRLGEILALEWRVVDLDRVPNRADAGVDPSSSVHSIVMLKPPRHSDATFTFTAGACVRTH
jgi:hypothetical protein